MNISDPTAPQAETYLQNISLDDIKKIEILKSPQGSVHGGQAAGGVISITTDEGIFNGKKLDKRLNLVLTILFTLAHTILKVRRM